MCNNKINNKIFLDPKYWREVHEIASCFSKTSRNTLWQKHLMQIAYAAFEVEMLVRIASNYPRGDLNNPAEQWKEQD
jgi:hypothetical protein